MWFAALMSAFGNDVIFRHFRGFGLLVVDTDVEFHRHRRRWANVVSAGPGPPVDRIAGWIPVIDGCRVLDRADLLLYGRKINRNARRPNWRYEPTTRPVSPIALRANESTQNW
jgi:hypothetical protein